MLNKVREAVSADRRRFKEDGFNLDLSYVTPRIIAMAIPSDGIQAAYRNHMDDVDALLRKNHGENFMIWNLSEFSYDAKFSDKVIHLPFPDHHPPPLDLYLKLVEMMDNWLRADENHVAVVHCKGGKGRTGTVVVSLLFFRGECSTVEEAEQLFASMRSSKSKGVTQPSQRRYIQYFKTVLLQDRLINYQPIRLRSVTIAPLLSVRPILLQIFNGVTDDAPLLFSQMKEPVAFGDSTAMIKFNIELDVRGDLYFKVFRRKDKDRVERAFHVVMHSFFIASTQFILDRKDLDHLKSSDKRFSNDLSMTFQFSTPHVPRLYPDRDDLHERMANKYLLSTAGGGASLKSSEGASDGASLLSEKGPVALKKKTMRTNKMAHGELHKDGLGGDGSKSKKLVYDHPLVNRQVQLALSSGDPSAIVVPAALSTTPSSQSASIAVAMKSSTFASQTTALVQLEPCLFEDDDEDDLQVPPTEPPPLPPQRSTLTPRAIEPPTTPVASTPTIPVDLKDSTSALTSKDSNGSVNNKEPLPVMPRPPSGPVASPTPMHQKESSAAFSPEPPSLPPKTLGEMRKSRRDLNAGAMVSSAVARLSQDKFSIATSDRKTPPPIPPKPHRPGVGAAQTSLVIPTSPTSSAGSSSSAAVANSSSPGSSSSSASTASSSTSNWSTATPSGSSNSGRMVRMTARPVTVAPASTPGKVLQPAGWTSGLPSASPTLSSQPSMFTQSLDSLPLASSPPSSPAHSPLSTSFGDSPLPARASLTLGSLSASDELDSGSDSDSSSDSEEYYDMDFTPTISDPLGLEIPSPSLDSSQDDSSSETRRGTFYPIKASPSSEAIGGRPTRKAPTIPLNSSPQALRPSASPDNASSSTSPRP